MMAMQRISAQVQSRRFNEPGKQYRGYIINPQTGRQDTGGVTRQYKQFVLEEATARGFAAVLSADPSPYPPETYAALCVEVATLNPLSNAFAKHTGTIMHITKMQDKRNEQAQSILGIMRDSMVSEIWAPIKQLVDFHRDKSELVLTDALQQITDRYDGLPHERKEHIDALVAAVGKCVIKSDILLVIARLSGIQSETKEWLHHQHYDVEAHEWQRVPDDVNSPQHPEQYWCRALSKRLESQHLQRYRDKTIVAMRAPECNFQNLCEDIMQDLQYDLEVADTPTDTHPRQAMVAQDIIHAAYHAGMAEAGKRQRLGEPAPAPAPAMVPAAGGALAVATAAPPRTCNFWNGQRCSFAGNTGYPCRYAYSHTAGIASPTYVEGVEYVRHPAGVAGAHA